jgi:hypothetical protein
VNTSVFFLIVERVVLKCTFSLFLCCVFGIDLNIQLSTTVQLNPTNTINRLKIFYNGIKKKKKTKNCQRFNTYSVQTHLLFFIE